MKAISPEVLGGDQGSRGWMLRMRDLLAHRYFDDHAIVAATVVRDLPPLLAQ
ncbi:MAG: hypothetical protein R2705_13810 [Ilumatobacteraceae bacterium]